MFSRKQGFTLVEIMIVVAIIALLAAIAIPNLLRSRLNAAETNARAILRTLSTASESFAAARGRYPNEMGELTEDPAAYIHEDYTAETQQGYSITVVQQTAEEYSFGAVPTGAFANAGRAFAVCTGGITAESDGPSTDVPVCPPESATDPDL